MTEPEGHERVTIIDSVKVLTLKVLLQVVLNNWGLMDGSSLGSGCVNANAISESEDVFESLVLKSVGVNIYNTFLGSDARIKKLLMGLAGRVNHSREEILFNGLSSVDISECCNLLAVLILLN